MKSQQISRFKYPGGFKNHLALFRHGSVELCGQTVARQQSENCQQPGSANGNGPPAE